ncbi:aminotransferase class V-fold PLP-dependent enzyme [Senegalia massiliensis]|uniref:cysteine desulfurase n=1 Tax=Senegalia massiliensis TaxID=1720316 RepID=A0A845R2C5_9CLOT|nr:aminotransferase class V-fold PLP-dependent enzyme [Senegalia massiliensis]NBI08129.1 aminotransferase class V-fold PLP-dependent enzyme [Senegalia massiliensis]
MIYLDNAATTFKKPEIVYEKIIESMREYGANPGRGGHKLSLKAGRGIYETREILAKLFNINNPMNIIFTYNATEALNLGIKGLLEKGDHVITTAMEHNSVLRPIKALENLGVENTIVKCDSEGFVELNDIKRSIKKNTKLIVTTHASNITGTIFPIKEIGELAKANNIIYMVDAAQTAGVYDIDVESMNIDILAFAGHKSLLGPQGTGGLYIKEGINIRNLKEGGTGSKSHELVQPSMLPDRYESGTPNTPGIIALGAGVKYILDKGIENIRNHEIELLNFFINEIKDVEGVILYGPTDVSKRVPVILMNIGNEDSSEVSYILDSVFDIATRSGLHCAPLAHKTIGTLERGAVRFSIGPFNTKEDIAKTLKAIKQIAHEATCD